MLSQRHFNCLLFLLLIYIGVVYYQFLAKQEWEPYFVRQVDAPVPFFISLPNPHENSSMGEVSYMWQTGTHDASMMHLMKQLLLLQYAPDQITSDFVEQHGKTLCKRQIIVDVGARFGFFSLLAASFGCMVVSYESQAYYWPYLQNSISFNKWEPKILLAQQQLPLTEKDAPSSTLVQITTTNLGVDPQNVAFAQSLNNMFAKESDIFILRLGNSNTNATQVRSIVVHDRGLLAKVKHVLWEYQAKQWTVQETVEVVNKLKRQGLMPFARLEQDRVISALCSFAKVKAFAQAAAIKQNSDTSHVYDLLLLSRVLPFTPCQ